VFGAAALAALLSVGIVQHVGELPLNGHSGPMDGVLIQGLAESIPANEGAKSSCSGVPEDIPVVDDTSKIKPLARGLECQHFDALVIEGLFGFSRADNVLFAVDRLIGQAFRLVTSHQVALLFEQRVGERFKHC
jgi:hypothetical protein